MNLLIGRIELSMNAMVVVNFGLLIKLPSAVLKIQIGLAGQRGVMKFMLEACPTTDGSESVIQRHQQPLRIFEPVRYLIKTSMSKQPSSVLCQPP